MLEFFRKYQRIFFLFITVVIVISFSFFGTYNALPPDNIQNDPAFRAIDGSVVTKQELNEMVLFLSTDGNDKLLYGGMWGPNFLNDGAIGKLLLQTEIAQMLASQFSQQLAPDLNKKLANEKRYSLYRHPDASFISVQTAWNYFAPTMNTDYNTLKQADSPLTPEAFAARTRLYLSEKNFSPAMLRQVLSYQEKQLSGITPDEYLARADLSLFNYHTLEDWFGPRFITLAAEFIIDSAKIAEQKGYRVSKNEALASLIENSNKSFKQNLHSPHLGVANSREYFKEQLRRMGMDENKAVKIWRTVLLASRLFEEAGNSVFVSPELFSNFVAYAKEPVSGDLYQLPKELKLSDYVALQKFEIYLDAVTGRSEKDKSSLELPEKYLSADEVAKKFPELVQKRYVLDVAEVDKNDVQTKIGIKDTWNRETENEHWKLLVKKFPSMGFKETSDMQERYAILDKLNDKSRAKVDDFTRSRILSQRPELISQALESATSTSGPVSLSLKGPAGNTFKGVDDVSILIALLDKAPVGDSQATPEQEEANRKLASFTGDQQHFYRIQVIEREPDAVILTFAEANRLGILDKILDRTLAQHYLDIGEAQGNDFKKPDGSRKELSDVKNKVADSYFAKVLEAIQKEENDSKKLTGDTAASKRLLPHVKAIQSRLKSDPEKGMAHVKATDSTDAGTLDRQWHLEKKSFSIERGNNTEQIGTVEALELPVNAWSRVIDTPSGAIFFYRKLESAPAAHDLALEKSRQEQQLLSGEAKRLVAARLIDEFKNKQAISLNFMDASNGEEALD